MLEPVVFTLTFNIFTLTFNLSSKLDNAVLELDRGHATDHR